MTSTDQAHAVLFQKKNFLEHTRGNEKGISAPYTTTLADGTRALLLDTGILQLEPANGSDKNIVISAGVHGNETAPIEIVDNMVRSILTMATPIRNRTLFIIGNPVAMNMGQRFDIENLNRLFCGKHEKLNHHEAVRAGILENAVSDFFGKNDSNARYHYDLHTAIRGSKHEKFFIYPYPDGRSWDKAQLQFFLAAEINTALLGHRPASTFSYFSSHFFKAHAFTVELGQVKPFGQNDMAKFEAITRNLTLLISGGDIPLQPYSDENFHLFRVKTELIKRSDTFRLNFADGADNFSTFKKDFQLTEDTDGGYHVENDGEAIVFPNTNVPIGQRAGLVVERTQLDP